MTEEQINLMKRIIEKYEIDKNSGEWTLAYLGVYYGLSEKQMKEYLLGETQLEEKHEKMLYILLGLDMEADSMVQQVENPAERLLLIMQEHFGGKDFCGKYEKVMQYILKDAELSAAQIEQLRLAVAAKMPEEDVLEMARNRKDVMEIRRCVEFFEMTHHAREEVQEKKKSRRDGR